MTLNIKTILAKAILVAIVTNTQAQEHMSLDSILTRIDRQNLTLKAYNDRSAGILAKAGGSKAWMAPMVGAGTFMYPYPGQEVMDARDKGAYMFSFEQDIPNIAKQNRQKEYQLSLADVEREGRNVKYNDLRGKARTYYYEWLVLEKKSEIAKEDEQLLSALRKLAQIRHPYNKASLSSIYSLEARLYEAQNMQAMLRGEIKKKMYGLSALMNLDPAYRFSIDTTVEVGFKPVIDTSYFHHKHSIIQQMDKSIESMNLNIKAMKSEAKPEFRIRFDHMSSRDAMMPKQFTAMAMLSIPIAPWASKMYKSETKSMQFDVSAMKNERDAMLNEMKNMVASMLVDLNSMQTRINNYEQKILPSLKKSFDVNNIAYEENRLDLPQLLQSYEALNMSRMNYLNDLQSYYLMVAEYEREIEQ